MYHFFVTILLLSTCHAFMVNAINSCQNSDKQLLHAKNVLCASLGGCQTSNVTGLGDWPSQAIYMKNLLDVVVAKNTCLNTTTSHQVIAWLAITNITSSPWWYTWYKFQIQYYDMPRVPGSRIESPATLGRKCFAFAYLQDIWQNGANQGGLRNALTNINLPSYYLNKFVQTFDAAIPLMNVCNQVMANCFVNASYNPMLRNGSCSESVQSFWVGYQWENLGNGVRNNSNIQYPFPKYNQTAEFEIETTFAVNVAVNEII